MTQQTDIFQPVASMAGTDNQMDNHSLAMRLDYQNVSQVISQQNQDTVALFSQINRTDVAFFADVKQPLLFRDCLLSLFDIVSADYRYVPKDRSAYTAFMQLRRASANKNLFASQQAYFDWLYNNDPMAYCILDPIVQVHESGVTFEVFSKDEGCYASLTFDKNLFDIQDNLQYGTTHIDYSSALLEGIEQIRSYRNTTLNIGQQAITLTTPKPDIDENQVSEVIEKRIQVPTSWVRSLLQVQSATQLSHDSFELDPVALYNLLFEMRMNADIKGKKRGLVIELVPQKPPVLTLEPFGIVVKSGAKVYQGQSAKLLRLWGRRRLALLKKLLPYTDKVTVTLLGQGMPSYWTLVGQGFHLTFAMTGFSQANWSQALNFDLLLPKRPIADNEQTLSDMVNSLQSAQDINQLSKQSGKKLAELRQDLLTLAQQGLIRYDLYTQRYHYRPLSEQPLDMAQLAYHTLAEKHAYDLVSRPKAVSNLTITRTSQGVGGVALTADIIVAEDRRTYHSQLQLNDEGMVSRAECSCPQFLQHRLTQGVCSHLIALRLAYANLDVSKNKQFRLQQSKLFSKRLPNNQIEQIQLTLNEKKLIIERTGKKSGRQQRLFNQAEQAYQAFLNEIDHITAIGFLENQVI